MTQSSIKQNGIAISKSPELTNHYKKPVRLKFDIPNTSPLFNKPGSPIKTFHFSRLRKHQKSRLNAISANDTKTN